MSDSSLRQDIFDELEYEPSIDAAHVDVAVKDGIVTLTGNVSSFAQRMSLRDAVLRVRGVRAVVQEIEVVPAGTHAVTDEEIARRTVAMLNWNVVVPENAVQVEVRQGWVQLTGNVEWQYQNDAAESAIWRMPGVVGVSNNIKIVPAVTPADIKKRIKAALKRDAALEAQAVTVSVTDGTVRLEGRLKTWTERRAATRAAWSAPGVRVVENHITLV
ncbi:MAG: BON domain-containing protein [Phyllobacterium sp.]|uniref:BON domain-containing protein n=1 Tax=Phyllobacterium sp. TaxID=1871046 RepID=UPI0030EFFC69